jgi:hypothetical protein
VSYIVYMEFCFGISFVGGRGCLRITFDLYRLADSLRRNVMRLFFNA